MKVQHTLVLALTAIACAPGHVLAEGQTTRRLKATKAPSEKMTKTTKTTKSPSEKGTKAPKATILPKLEACVSTFDGADGSLPDVKGKVKTYFDGTMITFKASLTDAAPNCETCGIHIHEGTSCETVALQKGHYWTVGGDPWTTAGGAIYTSNYNGKGKANFMLDAGTTYEDNIGKVVVVHDMDGLRYACGVLSEEKVKGCKK